MLGVKIEGKRERSTIGNNKRLSRQEINAIKRAIEIENSIVKRAGKKSSTCSNYLLLLRY